MSDQLGDYHGKRDFDVSPEPRGRRGRGTRRRFVVQEHDATRLHWDLRLEHDGVLASWALPRFLPGDPGDNRMAIRTEDHPVEYLTFEGVIPAGSYGAGTMRVHDHGEYDVLKWEERKVEVELRGERLTGRWALFATGSGDADDRWMIHRMGDPLDPGAQPLPATIPPMLATAGRLPSGPDWAYEIKWDGVRAGCRSEPGRLSLWSRSGHDITARYPEIAPLGRRLREHRVILDGEIVALDADGRPSFQALQQRIHLDDERRVARLARDVPATYMIFDLLHLDGAPLADLPYDQRRELLTALDLTGPAWRTAEPVDAAVAGTALLAAVRRLGLEGIVAKRRDGPYLPGRRSRDWIKVRDRRTADLVVGGWLEGRGGRAGRIGSVLVGEPAPEGGLAYRGRVGSGFSAAALADLRARLEPLARAESPFAGDVAVPAGARWVEPSLLAQVGFTERSREGLLRHPVWLGLRDDVGVPLVLDDERTVRGSRTATARVGDRELRVTNLDKVLYPQTGTTKRDVLEYYAAIAPVLVPHLRGRALTLRRFPDGVDGEAFYEKRAPAHAPPWVRTAPVTSSDGAFPAVIADDAATLVWLAQLAALELHPSLARADAPLRPTCVVFDLDPGPPASIVECCRVAMLLRGMLDGVGLRCVPKTSGSKGLQVYVPLNVPDATFEATRSFSSAVARVLAAEEPGLVVDRQAKSARRGKVLIDWFQNDPSKTTVAVYSLRGRQRPGVSTPVTWDEVEAGAAGGGAALLELTPSAVLARVNRDGDLFADLVALSQRLPA